MKNLLITSALLLFGLFLFPAFTPSTAIDDAPALKYSKKVDAIIKNKCYGCHSADGKSDKAKAKLLWDELPNLEVAEQAEKLSMIAGVLDEGAMPPARMLESKPEMKLTEKETATMQKWASKMAKKVAK